jgi:hypothetical protein
VEVALPARGGDESFEGAGFEGAVDESGFVLALQGGARHHPLDRNDVSGGHEQERHAAGVRFVRAVPEAGGEIAQGRDKGVELFRGQTGHRRVVPSLREAIGCSRNARGTCS